MAAKIKDIEPATLVSVDYSRRDALVRVACALAQSPRFSSRITDEAQQDLLVMIAARIADKLLAA